MHSLVIFKVFNFIYATKNEDIRIANKFTVKFLYYLPAKIIVSTYKHNLIL